MATITFDSTHQLYVVRWTNIGSELRPEPRLFQTLENAQAFCRERGLKVRLFVANAH